MPAERRIAACTATIQSPATSTVDRTSAYKNLGLIHTQNGNFNDAIADFTNALELAPTSWQTRMQRAYVYTMNKDYKNAEADYDWFIDKKLNLRAAYYARGVAELLDRYTIRASQDFTNAVNLPPVDVCAIYMRGIAYKLSNDAGSARIYLRWADIGKTVEAENSLCEGYLAVISLHHEVGMMAYNRAIALEPQNAIYYFARGSVHFEYGEYGQAISDLSQSISLDANYPNAFYNRALSYDSTKQYDLALSDINRYVALSPQKANGYSWRGQIYAQKEQYDRAIEDYNAALKLSPNFADALAGRGAAYSHLKKYPEAQADLEKARQMEPNNSYVDYATGTMYLALNDAGKAISYFQEATQANPTNSDAFNQLCWLIATTSRDLDTALADCDKAVKLDPANANYLDSRGMVKFKLGEFRAAIADYDTALTDSPKLASSLYVRGIAKQKLGQKTDGDADIAAAKVIEPGIADEFSKYGVTP